MRRLILMMAIVAVLPAVGMAQRPEGYVYVAPGTTNYREEATLQFGGGWGGPIYKGLGAGLELGYLAPIQRMDVGLGVFSANGSYHFLRESPSGKLVPFVSGGYSLGFRSRTSNGFNFGGGVNYWLRDGMGLRFEARDQVFDRTHFYGFRIGLTFR